MTLHTQGALLECQTYIKKMENFEEVEHLLIEAKSIRNLIGKGNIQTIPPV